MQGFAWRLSPDARQPDATSAGESALSSGSSKRFGVYFGFADKRLESRMGILPRTLWNLSKALGGGSVVGFGPGEGKLR